VAAIGFAFDIYALLVLPLIVRPALTELGRLKPGTPEFNSWVGMRPANPVPRVLRGIMIYPGEAARTDFREAIRLQSRDPLPYLGTEETSAIIKH